MILPTLENKETLKQIWKNLGISSATVINLRERKDRQAQSIQSAEQLCLPIKFFYADKHPLNGTAGCFASHQQVCKEALQKGLKKVLVLEDDFCATNDVFTMEGLNALKEAVEFANSNDDWHIIYLGVVPNVWTDRTSMVGKYLYSLKPWACTHAMIIHENYMKQIVEWTFNSTEGKDAYDWRHRKCEKAFAFHPQAIKQRESPSDVRNFQIPLKNPVLRDLPLKALSAYARYVHISLLEVSAIIMIFVVLRIVLGKTRHQLKKAMFHDKTQ
jgi:GR25 family glycosyltransferase involved in LPS biosynthesis